MTMIKSVILMVAIFIIATLGVMYSGAIPIGADTRHSAFTFWLLETTRKNAIYVASKNISVPSLDKPEQLLSGGADYNDMCADCHLKPGVSETDMTIGLYPSPPDLTQKTALHEDDLTVITRQQFWVIKHGIMASGMAAFGPTHSDERIWAMVAFLQKLPELTPLQYQIITARK